MKQLRNIASIDLGTNSCLLLVQGSLLENGAREALHDESNIVRLGQDLGQEVDQNKQFVPKAMERTLNCLKGYAEVVKKFEINPSDVIAVGTAQARDAVNAVEFFKKIEETIGFKFQILSEEQEAFATFMGAALPGMDISKMVVIDIGGGSTEIADAKHGESLRVGSVKMTERFFKSDPVTEEEFLRCQSEIDLTLYSVKSVISNQNTFVAVAGTAVTLAMLHLGMQEYDPKKIDGFTLHQGDVHRLVEELKCKSIAERKLMVGMEDERADVMLAGGLILSRAMEVLGFHEVIISTKGLRYGVLTSNFLSTFGIIC